MQYKLRCEFQKDAYAIINGFHRKQLAYNIKLNYSYLEGKNNNLSVIPDCDIEFNSSLNKDDLIKTIWEIENETNPDDGIELHVPRQSLQLKKDYTGKRDFSIN